MVVVVVVVVVLVVVVLVVIGVLCFWGGAPLYFFSFVCRPTPPTPTCRGLAWGEQATPLFFVLLCVVPFFFVFVFFFPMKPVPALSLSCFGFFVLLRWHLFPPHLIVRFTTTAPAPAPAPTSV